MNKEQINKQMHTELSLPMEREAHEIVGKERS